MKKLIFLFLPLFSLAQTKQGATTTGYGLYKYQIFTSTGGWTAPNGVANVDAQCWAGGGPGGNSSGNASGRGSGGQGGGYAQKNSIAVTGNISYTVTVGASQITVGSPGNDSWFSSSSTVLAKGGASGLTGASSPAGAPTAVSTGGIGDIVFYGGNGGAAGATNSGAGGGGANKNSNGGAANLNTAGASTDAGSGAAGVSGGSAGLTGNVQSGGGSGASSNNTTTRLGGGGQRGDVRLTWQTTHLGFF